MTAGLLLVGHGTRDTAGQREFLRTAAAVAARLPQVTVEPAFLELAQPDISTGLARLRDRGVRSIVCIPMLLLAAGHARRDVPQAVQDAAARFDLPPLTIAPHLGCHCRLVALSERRCRTGWPDPGGSPPEVILLVARGNRDPVAWDEMQRFAALRQAAESQPEVRVAFLDMGRPAFDDVCRELLDRQCGRVIVQPHLLFRGQMLEQLQMRVAALPGAAEWTVIGHLGPAPELVDVVVDRFLEARST